ncbi:YecA family protein [Photobacterium sp. 1_MG-2023]|uniref:YecA/YgfB family protein n=1 Tax=Photobacterium sp. 1_MG-2023 TaxID=3062646 RepID=UPI0026E2A631|nr:YecA family protein [Photobacterium sp. 1_MG-2023]MDO6708038.1 YecA family protein [Photobacterium sp. 1_MG-2023]
MSEVKLPAYEAVDAALKIQSLAVTPSELHGLLTGMLCGGLPATGEQWIGPIADYANNGESLGGEARAMTQSLVEMTAKELAGTGFEVSLLMPDDEAALLDRAEALSEWVNCFLSGLGLMGLNHEKLPASVQEALGDLQDIAQLGIDEEDDMEEQAALFEQVIEHVRMCALTCFFELVAKHQGEQTDKPTLH